MSDKPFRLLPQVTDENEHFWTGGAEGELRVLRCEACAELVHPPAPLCPACFHRELSPHPLSGRAHVVTYTVNHHPWIPGFDPPYVIAIVEVEEQPGLRITTNLVDCDPDAIEIGMPVEVRFEAVDDGIHLPLFAPAPSASAG